MTTTQETSIILNQFLTLPETTPATEYICGKLYRKPMPQGEHSLIKTRLAMTINNVGQNQKIALALCELRCTFEGRSIVPDIAVFTWSRIPKTPQGKINNRFEVYPDWIIEILSPEQAPNQVIEKILFCINCGADLGWFIDSEDESIVVFQPNRLPFVVRGNERLPTIAALSDFEIQAVEIFDWLKI